LKRKGTVFWEKERWDDYNQDYKQIRNGPSDFNGNVEKLGENITI